MKKKLPVVNCRKGVSSSEQYGVTGTQMHFAFVTKHEDDTRTQATGFMTCREYVCKSILAQHMKVNGPYSAFGKDTLIDTEKLRLMIAFGPNNIDTLKPYVFTAKAAINTIESAFDIEDRLKISTANHEKSGKVFLLTGSKVWLSTPQLLSLFLLIMRGLSYYKNVDTTSFDTIERCFEGLRLPKNDRKTSDSMVLSSMWDKVFPIIAFRDEIFKDVTIEQAYSIKKGICDDTFRSRCGVQSFIEDKGISYNENVAKSREMYEKIINIHLPRENHAPKIDKNTLEYVL